MTTISEGKRYRDRKGDEHGPMDPTGRADYPWKSPDGILWTADGYSLPGIRENPRVLVAEVDAPIAPETTIDEPGIDQAAFEEAFRAFNDEYATIGPRAQYAVRCAIKVYRECSDPLRARAKTVAEG